jgi:hypothetical protein
MSDDDLLRSILEQEARLVPMRHDAHDALAALEPAFRRATIKRASLIAASTVLVLGGTVAAFGVVRPTDDEISVVSPVTDTTEPLTTTVTTGSTRVDPDGVPTSLLDDSTIHSPIEISGDDPEHSGPSSTATTSVAPAATTVPTTERSGDGVDPTPPAPTPAPTAPPVTTPATPASPPPSITAPADEQLTRYDSTCGSVLADLATSPPTIVEVVVASGYRYRIEDPDGDSITVQFTGPGEDCEVEVGTHDDADHAEHSESEESGDDSSESESH